MTMKIGISVSIYCYDENSFDVSVRCLTSLIENSRIVDNIIIVDDGSPYEKIHSFYSSYKQTPGVQIILNGENIGIGKTKNKAIRLMKDCDIIILSDNDVSFCLGWDTFLTHSFVMSGVHSISLSNLFWDKPEVDNPKRVEHVNGVTLNYHSRLQGCFIAFTKDVLNNIGGYPSLPTKYGQEHCNFQMRVARFYNHFPFVIDIEGLKEYVKFLDCPSHLPDDEKKLLSFINAAHSRIMLDSGIHYNDDYLKNQL
jgi:glycosyltransferase involved in cell wall biosynthesis